MVDPYLVIGAKLRLGVDDRRMVDSATFPTPRDMPRFVVEKPEQKPRHDGCGEKFVCSPFPIRGIKEAGPRT
jgi:hypothetical protein